MLSKRLLVLAVVVALVGAGCAGAARMKSSGWNFVGHGPAQLVSPQLEEGHNARPWTSTRSTR